MRINRTRDEWHAIFEAQQRSGLCKTQFCRQQGITRSAFSSARMRFSANTSPVSAFIPALPPEDALRKPEDTPDTLSAGRPEPGLACTSPHQLALILPGATLSLPVDISPRWLAILIREIVR